MHRADVMGVGAHAYAQPPCGELLDEGKREGVAEQADDRVVAPHVGRQVEPVVPKHELQRDGAGHVRVVGVDEFVRTHDRHRGAFAVGIRVQQVEHPLELAPPVRTARTEQTRPVRRAGEGTAVAGHLL
ncbi:hypothetical protein QOZ89_25540 [Pseudofrankia sp. BMG5.37]|nr:MULTISPECIES: hypothetical protein [unclassified Pseudofrankia]MDT3442929.1 hypothetical protein [Pseudofrankia sp. BMG5.37]